MKKKTKRRTTRGQGQKEEDADDEDVDVKARYIEKEKMINGKKNKTGEEKLHGEDGDQQESYTYRR